ECWSLRSSPRRVRAQSAARAAQALTSEGARSAVVEEGPVQADERALPLGLSSGHRLGREVVGHAGGTDALGQVTPAVVALEEEATRSMGAGGQAPVPDVGDEEGYV